MRIVLLGPPGTGKGSLALLVDKRLHVAHVSTGEIFRHEIAANSALGKRVQKFVSKGMLVPNELVVQVMTRRLGDTRYARGFILDGFPRTKGQAEGLARTLAKRKIPFDGAVYIESPESVLVRRLSGRRVCVKCGANYHIRTMRPKRPGVCDHCGGALKTRADDQPATVKNRLAVDRKTSAPLLNFYRKRRQLWTLDGRGHIETVYKRAVKLFFERGWIDHIPR